MYYMSSFPRYFGPVQQKNKILYIGVMNGREAEGLSDTLEAKSFPKSFSQFSVPITVCSHMPCGCKTYFF